MGQVISEPLPNLMLDNENWMVKATLVDGESYSADIYIPSSMYQSVAKFPFTNSNLLLAAVCLAAFQPAAWERLAEVNRETLTYDAESGKLTVRYSSAEYESESYTRTYGIEEADGVDSPEELLHIIVRLELLPLC